MQIEFAAFFAEWVKSWFAGITMNSSLMKPLAAGLAIPGLYIMYKFHEYREKERKRERRRFTDKDLQTLNRKIVSIGLLFIFISQVHTSCKCECDTNFEMTMVFAKTAMWRQICFASMNQDLLHVSDSFLCRLYYSIWQDDLVNFWYIYCYKLNVCDKLN